MIYTCGINDPGYQDISIQEMLEKLNFQNGIAVDTETSGLSYVDDDLKCIQLGDGFNEFVIHAKYLQQLKWLLEGELLLFQNAKFDLKFLYKHGIHPNRVYDTFLAEGVLYCGYELHKKSLAAIAKSRLGITIDKTYREGIEKKAITGEYIEYAAADVRYLHDIREHQLKEAKEKDLLKCINLENDYVLCLAYIEFCGIHLDADQWKVKMEKDFIALQKSEKQLDQYVVDNKIEKYLHYQTDAFEGGKPTVINWNSAKQVVEFFKDMGVDVATGKIKKKKEPKVKKITNSLFGDTVIEKITDKTANRKKQLYSEYNIQLTEEEAEESVSAKNIQKYEKQFPFIKIYLEYKELQKVVGTYGESVLKQINPKTGRIHTNFTQIMDTGRTSCGGNGTINLQNIPNNPETRNCFTAEEGNVIIDCDYTAQEILVLCNRSLEPGLLAFFDNGLSDLHSYNASMIFKECRGLTPDEVKKKFKDKRNLAKVGVFCINYGGSAQTLAAQLNISLEEAEEFSKNYFLAYPDLEEYFKKCENQALRDGYILIDERNKRKCYIWNFDKYKKLKAIINKDFWTEYKVMKNEPDNPIFLDMKVKVKEYFQIQGEISRMSKNYPIQGQSAGISKIAGIKFLQWLKDEKLLNIVKMVNMIHDAYMVECSDELAERVSKNLVKCMEDAAALYCKRVKLSATPLIAKFWDH